MKKNNVTDLEKIKSSYFNLKNGELEKYKTTFNEHCKKFGNHIKNIEADLEKYYEMNKNSPQGMKVKF